MIRLVLTVHLEAPFEKKVFLFVILTLIFITASGLGAEPKNMISTSITPYGTIPLGSSEELFNLGTGAEATATFIPAFLRYFGLSAGTSFMLLPLESKINSVWTLAAGGPVFWFPLGNRFVIHAHGRAGYYYWSPTSWDAGGVNTGSFTLGGGAGASIRIANSFSVGLGISYNYYSKLYNGLDVYLSARLDFPPDAQGQPVPTFRRTVQPKPLAEKGRGVESLSVSLYPLFPVLYNYYDNNPIGQIAVKNLEPETFKNVQVSFFVERYMDNPMECGDSFTIEPDEIKELELFGLFTEDLMEITEGTKVSAKITLSYSLDDETYIKDFTSVLEFYNRNALMWDDDRKIASFVTAKDPEILEFARNAVSWMQTVKNPALDDNLQKGMAVYEAVKAYGIQYEIDPTTPFSEFSEQETAIDFLQFPRQTLQFTSGDCDDLTVLYTSLLEAVGVETAIITVPGHIYAAFALKLTQDEAQRTFGSSDELVFRNEKAWIPVEITMFQDTFEKAWQTGAKEWRENTLKDQSQFYPTREAWQYYQAVGFKEGAAEIQLPPREIVTNAVSDTINRYVEKEIYPQAAQIEAEMEQSDRKYKYLNKLAVLNLSNYTTKCIFYGNLSIMGGTHAEV